MGSHYGLKQCNGCKEYKARSLFHKDKSKSDGVHTFCKLCRAVESATYYRKPKRKRHVKLYAKTHKEKRRVNTLKYMYNLSMKDYNKILLLQNGVCAICCLPEHRKTTNVLCVDHCHKTGKIRGLLCHVCNSAIGKLKDDPILLKRAISYLESFV